MQTPPLHLELKTIHWIAPDDDGTDLCSHGQMEFRIGDEWIVQPKENDLGWALTGTAMHLLRTLERNHTEEDSVGEYLIVCCGHMMDHQPTDEDVHIWGCFDGINVWVEHKNEEVIFTTPSERQTAISFNTYRDQVLRFCEHVEAFYANQPPRITKEPYDQRALELLWAEWHRRTGKWPYYNRLFTGT